MADEARSGTTKEVPGKTGGAPADMERRLHLARLKKAWLALGPGDHDEEARIALQKDSIEALMCSFEMHELSVFLREHEIRLGYPGGSLTDLSARIFNTAKASEARDLLLRTLGSDIPKDVLEDWCETAGFWCQAEDFEAFFQEIHSISPSLAAAAMFGRCLVLRQTDPILAVNEMLRAIGPSDGKPDDHNDARFSRMLDVNRLPQDTDFESIARIFEIQDPSGSRFDGLKHTLFYSWGERDPAAAANFIMADPERYPAELVEIVGNRSPVDLEGGLQWVAQFPQGVYRDMAALGLVRKFCLPRPEDAKRFLPLIGSPKARAEAHVRIMGAERTIESGDKY